MNTQEKAVNTSQRTGRSVHGWYLGLREQGQGMQAKEAGEMNEVWILPGLRPR